MTPNDALKKVLFVLPSLESGGAERVMSYIAQNLDKSKFMATLLVTGQQRTSAYKITGIEVIYLEKERVLTAIPSIFKFLLKKKPNVVVSAIAHLNAVMAFISIFFPKIKFLGREVNVLSVLKDHSETDKGLKLPYLVQTSYKLLDMIICQSNDMANDLCKNYGIPSNKLIIINNPITQGFKIKKYTKRPKEHIFKFVTVGRLAKQKGHARLLDVLSKIDFPFHYTIIGDGPERDNISQKINILGLASKITMVAYTDKVAEYLAVSDLFLQGSFVEGFPNALLESCAVGTPVIAFRAPGGIDEIIDDGVNGFIAENIEDFVNKIKVVVNSSENFKPIEIRQSVYKKYNSKKILEDYQRLIASI